MMTTIPLGTDAMTAHRLMMDRNRAAPVGETLAAWTAISWNKDGNRRQLSELPAELRREGVMLLTDEQVDPIRLTLDQAYAEAMRLAALQRGPDADGYLDLSVVARIGKVLARHCEGADAEGGFTRIMRSSPLFETRNVHNVIGIRFKGGDMEFADDAIMLVETRIEHPGILKQRAMESQTTYGDAQRAVLRLDTTLAADGTRAVFTRGDERRTAAWNSELGWRMEDGSPMRRISQDDPIRHGYANGRLVNALIGFVTITRTGRIIANVGIAHDSDGDQDAHIGIVDHKEVASVEQGLALLDGRGDLDHVFRKVQKSGSMGFWLTCMED